MLTRRHRSRIFQTHNCSDMTVGGIVKQVLDDAGISSDSYRFALSGTYTAREYVVQYRETEMDFISRLMEEEGLFYFFEHTAEGHKMVIADSAVAHVVSPIDGECTYREPTGLVAERNTLFSLRETADIQSGSVRLKDFDFVKPGTDIGAVSSADRFADLEISDYPGKYQERADGTKLTQVLLEEQQCRKRVLRMAGDVRGLIPGFKFAMIEHPDEALNIEYLVTHVTQNATQPQSAEESAGGGSGTTYGVDLRVIPADVPFRAPLVTPRPRAAGSQTALVVGPSGEEIYTDNYARIKVQFHWDLVGEYNENSSRWIRVSQGMAGGQYGMMFLPRVGQEVVVDFLEGDPDRPIVTGRVYNNDQMPPYTLPDEKTKSTIKTHTSTGGGGTNEIRFEDKAGEEQLLFYAQKDMHLRVLNNRVENVVMDRHLTVDQHKFEHVNQNKHNEVTLDFNEKVGGKMSLDVTGDHGVKAGGNYSHEASKIYLKAGQDVVIEGATGLTLKVGGNFIKIDPSGVSIQGTLTKINSGGAAGAGTAVALTAPEATIAADEVTPGADITYQATPVEATALEPPAHAFAPAEVPPEEEKITSWVEIELVDEEGQPVPDELYELTYPDGTTRRGKLDRNGLAHIGLREQMDIQVTFPHFDAEAWERIE
jgi:type VI secretion system secreted protein VgrG